MFLSWHCVAHGKHVSEEELATDLRNQSEQAVMLQDVAMSLKPWMCFLGASEGDQQEAAMAASRMLQKLQEFCNQQLKQLACDLAKDT